MSIMEAQRQVSLPKAGVQISGCIPQVQQVMIRKVLVVCEDTPLAKASKLMGDHKIRHLVVTDALRNPVGVFSDRDVFKFMARRMANSQEVYGRLPVKELMVKSPVTILAETLVTEAAGLLARQKVGCLVVVDAWGRLAGILTIGDVLRCFAAFGQTADSMAAPRPAKVEDGIRYEDSWE